MKCCISGPTIPKYSCFTCVCNLYWLVFHHVSPRFSHVSTTFPPHLPPSSPFTRSFIASSNHHNSITRLQGTWHSPSRWSVNSGVLQLSLPKLRLTRPYEALLRQQKYVFSKYLESRPRPFFNDCFLKQRMNWCDKPSLSLGNHHK